LIAGPGVLLNGWSVAQEYGSAAALRKPDSGTTGTWRRISGEVGVTFLPDEVRRWFHSPARFPARFWLAGISSCPPWTSSSSAFEGARARWLSLRVRLKLESLAWWPRRLA